uniref:Uncharacterized protein n=1 Tax=Vitis vinifera TaxID=29760 RepID=A5BTX4_VITVI|nr:hypothetical protein VITISV_021274 [Vitis vinifera]
MAHECHFAAQEPPFRNCETHCEVVKPDFATKILFRRVFRNCEGEFGTRVPLRSTAAKCIAKWLRKWHFAAKMAFCCENGILLRKWHFAAKMAFCCENGILLRNWHFAAKLKLTLSLPLFLFIPPKAIPPPVKPAPPKPPAKRYLTRSGGRPLQKRPRVESSEPIDLTEQSPEPSPIPSPVPTPVPSPSPLPVPSPVPSLAPQSKAQEPQTPLPEPQIPSEIAPEEIIRRPMLTQPPIEGNLDCRARPFHSELCFDIAAFRVRPELAQTFNLLRRYHMEHLLTPRDFFYPRVAMDFYQSMTTNQVRDPTLIHFTIDGRHGILGARHIAEALQIPYEPTQFDDFRAWTNPTELEMVRTLSRGAANRSHLLRGELPPVMFLIDAFLHHNLYPLQHWTQRRGVLLEALYKMSEGFFFGPHHLILAVLLYFEEKLKRKRICRELFTLDKWNNMTAYKVDQPEQPQPAARRASPRHIPEGITVAAPAIPRAPPAAPASSQSSTSAEPRMAIPISEYRELCRALETLTASQSSLAQEMAAIRACQEQMLATQAQHTAILSHSYHIEDNAQFGWGGMRKEEHQLDTNQLIHQLGMNHLRVQGVETLPPDDTERASLSRATPSGFLKRTRGALPYPDSLREKHTTLANNTPRTIA